MYTFRRFAAYSAAVAPRTYLEINNYRLRRGTLYKLSIRIFLAKNTDLSCHRVQAVFNGIPLFSELSSSFSDRLERCGDLLLSSVPPSSSFETQLCKKAFDNTGEALWSTAISRAVLWNHNKLRHECSISSIVGTSHPPVQGIILASSVTNPIEFIPTRKPNKKILKSIQFITEQHWELFFQKLSSKQFNDVSPVSVNFVISIT